MPNPRDIIFEEIYQKAISDKNVIVITIDMGAWKFQDFQKNIPDQFYNIGICEQSAISIASGLSLANKKVYVYAISCFPVLRAFEQIKIDICSMNRPVTIIGMGTGYGYSSDGPTHHIIEDVSLMRTLPNLEIWSLSDCNGIKAAIETSYILNKYNIPPL